jgi:hypothetical protein
MPFPRSCVTLWRGSWISLARFEENAGATNTSTVRLEGNAVLGVERTAAAVRITG